MTGHMKNFRNSPTNLDRLFTEIHQRAAEQDVERYQTIYAKHEGAVAAPTLAAFISAEQLLKG